MDFNKNTSQRIKDYIIGILKTKDHNEIYKIWAKGLLYKLEKEDLNNLIIEHGVNLIESILKSLHFIAYEQKKYRFDHEIRIIPSEYKEVGGKSKWIDKVDKNLIKNQVVEIIKKQDSTSLVPLLAAYFLNSLEPKDIQSLILDQKSGFFKNIIKILGDYDDELYYYCSDFYIGHLKFFEVCKLLNEEVIKSLNLSVINDGLVANYESIIEEGLLEKFSHSELIKILDNLDRERLEAFLISLAKAIKYFEDFERNLIEKSILYFENLEAFVTNQLKEKIINIFKNSKISPIFFSPVAEIFLINIWEHR